jgi:hypothetical protein
MLSVQRLNAHFARTETLGADVLENNMLSVRSADNRRTQQSNAATARGQRDKNCHELSGPHAFGFVFNREMHRNGLVAEHRAAATECEPDRNACIVPRRRLRHGGDRIEAERLDPKTRRIDDLKDNRIGLRQLSRDGVGLGNHTTHRRDQLFRLAPNSVERCLSFSQALQFGPRIFELRTRHRVTFDELLETRDTALDDCHLLKNFAFLLLHVGGVDRLDRRLDVSEHLTLFDTGAERRKAGKRRHQSAGQIRLHIPASVRVRNYAPRQFDSFRVLAGSGHRGPHGQDTLYRFRHKDTAVRKPLRNVARDLHFLLVAMIVALIRLCRPRERREEKSGKHKRFCQQHPGITTRRHHARSECCDRSEQGNGERHPERNSAAASLFRGWRGKRSNGN